MQSVITFHGGMQALTYEWGAPNHNNGRGRSGELDQSPDQQTNVGLAGSMQVSLSLRFKGLFLYTGDILWSVECCIGQL